MTHNAIGGWTHRRMQDLSGRLCRPRVCQACGRMTEVWWRYLGPRATHKAFSPQRRVVLCERCTQDLAVLASPPLPDEEEKVVCRSETKKDAMVGPLVLWGGVPLIEGFQEDEWGCDYHWHDDKHEVISFDFRLKAGDRFTVVYRDEKLNPLERVRVTMTEHVLSNSRFNVRTGETYD